MQGALNANKAIFFLIRWLLRVLCAYPGDLEGPCSCVRRKRDRQASRLHSFIKYEPYNSSRRATETGGGKSGVPCFATPTTGCCRSIQCKNGTIDRTHFCPQLVCDTINSFLSKTIARLFNRIRGQKWQAHCFCLRIRNYHLGVRFPCHHVSTHLPLIHCLMPLQSPEVKNPIHSSPLNFGCNNM